MRGMKVVGAAVCVLCCGLVGLARGGEPTYEFAEKPSVKKDGGVWTITFATKTACDATVAIVGPATSSGQARVVRHLASGVLGVNAPAPFQKNSLVQRLEWDGKDDDGKPAPAGCSVRVSLGLDARFEKLESWALVSGIRPLAVGKEGEVYAASSAHVTGAIHVFGKDGKYLRTLYPPPVLATGDGKVVPERFAPIAWNKTVTGDYAPRRNRFGGGFDYELTRYPNFFGGLASATVTADGKLCVLYTGRQEAVLFLIDARDGSCPTRGIVDLGRMATDGMAASPDGKWLYFAGRPANPWAKQNPFSHAVMRMSLEKPGAPQVFVGDAATAGNDNAHFDGPTSVACDKDGNVYVGDRGNNRIQVFKQDGTYIKTIAGASGLVGVSHKTGAIYLWYQRSWSQNPSVTKLGGLDNPAKAAELTIHGDWPGGQWREGKQSAILSSESDPPLIWFAGSSYTGKAVVIGIEDRGNTLVRTTDLLAVNETPAGGDITSPGMWTSLHADRRAGTFSWDPVEPSGNVLQRSMFWGGQPAGMPDNKMWVLRYDPKAKKYVSFEHGEPAGAPVGATQGYAPLLQDGQPVLGIAMYYSRGSHHHQGPFCAAPNGDIYVGATYAKQTDEEMEKAGLPRLQPKALGNVCAPVLRVYEPSGKLKHPNALPGLAELEGVRVGRSGAVYVVQPWKPLGQKLPEGLADGGSYEDSRWGSLIKFPGDFKTFPVGRIIGAWEPVPQNPTHEGAGMRVRVEGALWTYGGVSPHSAKYSACTCMKASSDLDDFERSFVCAAQTATINVIDSNGNVMARLGGYGNVDDLMSGKKLAFSLPRNVAATDDTMWVVDMDHRALVRAALVYRAQETVPLP